MSEDDKRQYPRAEVEFHLKYAPLRSESNDYHEASLHRDVSTGGISYVTDDAAPENGKFQDLMFTIDGLPGEIKAQGKVIRTWKEGDRTIVALEFTRINSADSVTLQDFIEDQLRETSHS